MIFDTLQQRKKFGNQMTFSVKMSCFEIYIQDVTDLFDRSNKENQSTNLSRWKAVEL